MSKEMKMAEQHELFDYAVRIAKSTAEIECRYKGGNVEDFWSSILVSELGRLNEENAALREALRLKEAECEALAGDKQAMQEVLVECMGELEMSYDVIEYPANGKTIQDVAAAKAGALLEDMNNENQQAD